MITVYIWPGLLQGNVGHASALIEDTYYATGADEYVSWWPAGQGGLSDFLTDTSIPGAYHTFEQDQADEGTAYHVVAIDGLDESAARAYWDLWKTDGSYRLFHRNCATTVAKVLAAANHDSLTVNEQSLWTPFGVWQYANTIYFVKRWF